MPLSRRHCLEGRLARGHPALAPNRGFAFKGFRQSDGASLIQHEGEPEVYVLIPCAFLAFNYCSASCMCALNYFCDAS